MRIKTATQGGNGGFITMIFIVLLGIMALYAVHNAISLHHLKRELKQLEQRQLRNHAERGLAVKGTHP